MLSLEAYLLRQQAGGSVLIALEGIVVEQYGLDHDSAGDRAGRIAQRENPAGRDHWPGLGAQFSGLAATVVALRLGGRFARSCGQKADIEGGNAMIGDVFDSELIKPAVLAGQADLDRRNVALYNQVGRNALRPGRSKTEETQCCQRFHASHYTTKRKRGTRKIVAAMSDQKH